MSSISQKQIQTYKELISLGFVFDNRETQETYAFGNNGKVGFRESFQRFIREASIGLAIFSFFSQLSIISFSYPSLSTSSLWPQAFPLLGF